MSQLPRQLFEKPGLLLLALIIFPAFYSDAMDNMNQNSWNPETKKQAVFQPGKIILKPENAAWKNSVLTGNDPIFFWNKKGLTVKMELTIGIAAPSPQDQYDSDSFIGLTMSGKARSIQSADNVVGLAIRWNQKNDQILVSLGRKERNDTREEVRGDQWGNIPTISPAKEIPFKDGKLSVEFKINEKTITASINGTELSGEVTEISEKIWNGSSFLIVQCQNSSGGRGILTINDISLEYPKVDLSKFQLLDLRKFTNMGFQDDKKEDQIGGWTDQGNNDLRYMPTGKQTFRFIPFDIIRPETNNGKSCIMLFSQKKDFFPKEVGPMPVGKTADSLIFLHSTAWGGRKAIPAAEYRVTFEDGSVVKIPITIGRQIDDWWSLEDVADPDAILHAKVKSDNSGRGIVGLYAYRWKNPNPEKVISSLSFVSTENDPVVGIVAVTLATNDIGDVEKVVLKHAFLRENENDYRKNPPDKDLIPDKITLKEEKSLSPDAFSASGSYLFGRGGVEAADIPGFSEQIKSVGGMLRYPYGCEINFAFWPYSIDDWYPVLKEKGGTYGAIMKWVYKGKEPAPKVIGVQKMLAAYKKNDLKMILLFNCVSMFNGKDFIYIKTLPEERMKKENPLTNGKFNQENLDKIMANNATLVDYVINNDYQDTVKYWEMDNERWDMPGAEYGATVASHIKMLRAKIPDAKIIVCLAGVDSYSANIKGTHADLWNRDLLAYLAEQGLQSQIELFAPHEYPFLHDNASDITQNFLEDWSIRNLYRDLDYADALLDEYGFKKSGLYISEWGVQSDGLGDDSRNDLISSMASALAAAKSIMAIYSHPRVAGGTLHPFLHASYVNREKNKRISKWGCQTLFYTHDGKFFSTPHLEAVRLFVKFATGSKLLPENVKLPAGVQVLCAENNGGKKYFVVNSTGNPAKFPRDITKRTTIVSGSVTDTSVKYNSYGDKPGDVKEILPLEFTDNTLPPYSISLLQ